MIFKTLTVQNFFSVGPDPISLNLDDLGVVLILGTNNDAKTSTSNGAGKSSIMESLLWVIYGKTIRDQNADDVVNRHVGKNCYVRVTIQDCENLFTIERYRKHESHYNNLYFKNRTKYGEFDLTQSTQVLTQCKIDRTLGINFHTFAHGPMLHQENFKRLSRMTDSEQKKVFENALQFQVFSESARDVREALSHTDTKLREAKIKLKISQEKTQNLKAQIKTKKQQVTTFKTSQNKTKVKFLERILKLEEEYQAIAQNSYPEIQPIENKMKLRKPLLAILEKLKEALAFECQTVSREEEALHLKHLSLENSLADVKNQLDSLKQLKDCECPTCRQVVTKKHVRACTKELNKKLSLLDKKLAAIAEERETLSEHSESLNQRYQELSSKHQQADTQLDQLQSTIFQYETEIESTKEKLQTLERYIEDQYTQYNEWGSQHTENSESLQQELDNFKLAFDMEKENLRALEDAVNKLEDKKHYLKFWQQGFSNSGIKTKILETVTPFLNNRVDAHSQKLTDQELKIRFNTFIRLKNGSLKDNFNINVLNRHGADCYKGNSGGEKARADLIINMAIADLIASRAQKRISQRFFDEPFDSLDEAGIEATLDMLNKMTEDCGSIFVISHRQDFKNLFQNVIHVEKSGGITRLVSAP